MITINKRSVTKCILLSLVTGGIYGIYWMCLLIENNRNLKQQDSGMARELLCLQFVPFYSMYWWFTRGKTVKEMSRKDGEYPLSNEWIYLVLNVFGLSIVAMAILQHDYNSMTSKKISASYCKKFEYKWIILIVCFLMVFTCLGFISSNKGLYLGAITKALGIKRSLFSLSDTCRFIASAVVNLFLSRLVSKLGIRKLVAIGFGCLISSVLIYAYATNILLFYLGGAMLGVGLAFTTTAIASIIVKRWFTGKTGTVLGVVLAANGLGGAVAAQIVTPIIGSHVYGYRDAYTLVAVIVAVVGVLAVLLLREKPKDHQGELISKNKKSARGGGWVGVEFTSAKKLGYFIPGCIGIFLTGMVLSGINGIGATSLRDAGLADSYVSNVLSIHSLVLLVSKMLAGVLYDKKGLRTVLTFCNVMGIASMVCLAFVANTPTGMVLAMIWGAVSSLALPMETIGVSLVTSDLFGNKSFEQMLGIMMALNHLGYALGSVVVNVLFDITGGTYFYAVLIFAGILLAVTVMYQVIITAANKQRKAVEAALQE